MPISIVYVVDSSRNLDENDEKILELIYDKRRSYFSINRILKQLPQKRQWKKRYEECLPDMWAIFL